MRRAFLASVAINMFVAFSLVASPAGAQTATTGPPVVAQQPAEKVSFCHRTRAVINPYRLITTDADSIVKIGHGNHTGPVFPADNWGDIIPPFEYSGGSFPGLNWPAGAAILAAGCAVHETVEPPEETTTTTAATTTTTAATTTTTAATTTSSSLPAGTTTTTTTGSSSSTTTTSAPSSSSTTIGTTTPGQTTTTGLAASGSTTTVAGETTTTAGTTAPGGTTTTTSTLAPPSGTSPPTTAALPADPPPVDALPPGAPVPDPPPQVLAFVITPGDHVVILGPLNPDQVRTLYQELRQQHLAHTGSDTSPLVLIALLTLVSGGALLGLAARRGRWTD